MPGCTAAVIPVIQFHWGINMCCGNSVSKRIATFGSQPLCSADLIHSRHEPIVLWQHKLIKNHNISNAILRLSYCSATNQSFSPRSIPYGESKNSRIAEWNSCGSFRHEISGVGVNSREIDRMTSHSDFTVKTEARCFEEKAGGAEDVYLTTVLYRQSIASKGVMKSSVEFETKIEKK